MPNPAGAEYTIDPVSLRARPVDAAAMQRCARDLQARAELEANPVARARSASQAALYFVLLGHQRQARQLIDLALAHQPAGTHLFDRTVTEIRLAQAQQFAGELEQSQALLAEIVARCRCALSVAALLDFALQHLGKVLFDRRRYSDALACFQEALRLREAKNDPELVASTELAIAATTRCLAENAGRSIEAAVSFRPLLGTDMSMLHDWLCRPHVSRWWGHPDSLAEVERDYLPLAGTVSTTRGHVALLGERPIGFVQSYVVAGSGEGWWEQELDPGARGIDLFLADVEVLGRGLGSAMIRAFVRRLFLDAAVSKVQSDPAPDNERAIRSYTRAGFVPQGEVMTPDGLALLMLRWR
jgi:RimJ/RimL family protein N-acetyltransferase